MPRLLLDSSIFSRTANLVTSLIPAWIFPATCYCFNILIYGQSSSFFISHLVLPGGQFFPKIFPATADSFFLTGFLLVRDTSTQGIFFFQFTFHPFSQARSKIRFCFSCR
jgi:hypothetical protein